MVFLFGASLSAMRGAPRSLFPMEKAKALITIAQRMRALAQTGLSYSVSDYETDRCQELLRLSDRITSIVSGLPD